MYFGILWGTWCYLDVFEGTLRELGGYLGLLAGTFGVLGVT